MILFSPNHNFWKIVGSSTLNKIITGDKINSGDYTYALNSDSTSYILNEYSGMDSIISIPKKI